MKIEKGQKYLCVKEQTSCFRGKIYEAIDENWIKSETGNYLIQGSEDTFHPIEQAKWAIKRTPENAEVVNRWANEKFDGGFSGVGAKVFSDYPITDENYTEIDFKTFKEITGMGEEKPKFQKGDTVVIRQCSKDTYWYADKIGKVFELDEEDSNSYWNIKNKFHLFLDPFYIQKIFTIEDVRNGKCAIENDGTVDELHRVICFALNNPDTNKPIGRGNFYWISGIDYIGDVSTDLPTQSVKLFLSQIEGEKEQVWEVGDFVKETFLSSPDRNKAYKILDINEDRVYYDRFDNCFCGKDKLQLIKRKELFSKATTECKSEEWQPKNENEFSPKWGEEVEVRDYEEQKWQKALFVGLNPNENQAKYITVRKDKSGVGIWSQIRQPIHTFTTEQVKQELAKLHNLNPEQIKII